MDTWISNTSDQLIWTLKKPFFFVPFNHLDHETIGSRVITGFLQLLGSLGSLVSISYFDQFRLYFPKSNVNGILCKHKWKKPKTYIRNQTYKWLVWMTPLISYTMADQLDHQSSFVCVSVSRITWISRSMIHFSKQIAPNKCQAYRIVTKWLLKSFFLVC